MSTETSPEPTELLPCPWCPDSMRSAYELDRPGGWWRCGCGGCGGHSGTMRTREQAIALWNRRAIAPVSPPPDVDTWIDAAMERINNNMVRVELGELLDPWPVFVARELRSALSLSRPAEKPATVEALARAFHEAYERLAPAYGYKTRPESAVPWEQVPESNRALMVATVEAVLCQQPPAEEKPASDAALLKDAMDALLWCSGSADFAPEGQARVGWERGPQRVLDAYFARQQPPVDVEVLRQTLRKQYAGHPDWDHDTVEAITNDPAWDDRQQPPAGRCPICGGKPPELPHAINCTMVAQQPPATEKEKP